MFGHLLSQQVVLDNAEKRAKFWCQISACFQKINEVKSEVMQAFSEALIRKNRKSSSDLLVQTGHEMQMTKEELPNKTC